MNGRGTSRVHRAELFVIVATLALATAGLGAPRGAEFHPATRVGIAEGFWHINGKVTCAGAAAEGLLMSLRAVHATFEDQNSATCPKGFDPEANTTAFLGKLPEYLDHGVLAFTLSLQGGDPGYEGALNSAYGKDGSLRPGPLARVARVIEACDRLGSVVILCCFHSNQDQVLADEAAVRRAVTETASWVRARGYTNVLLDIADEHDHAAYVHPIIRDPVGCAELVALAKATAPGLLVSASSLGDGRTDHQIVSAADFVLLHFSSVPPKQVFQLVVKASKASKAVVCNADDKQGDKAIAALEASVRSLCSWGYTFPARHERFPFRFEGARDDPPLFARLKAMTRPPAP